MPSRWEFQLPTRILFGRGGLRKLGEVVLPFGKAALLVGYREAAGLEETYDRARKALTGSGIRVVEFLEIPPDPDAELGEEGARVAGEAGVEVVVGLGGGSVIDAAKGIAAVARLGGKLWDYTGANPASRPVTDSLPVVAVPTTAGTGSEVTSVAVFTHHGVGEMPEVALKASIAGPAVPPKAAVVDPALAVGSPPPLTAACGADALGHAIESCMSRRANPISSALAARAVAMIVENLPRAVETPDDPVPREPLALAATLAGAAFSEAGVTMTHAIAQALGGVLHVPHGAAVAVGTPANLRYNFDQCIEVYAELARACALPGEQPADLAERFVQRICDLLERVGLPPRVQPSPHAPADLADRLARNAALSTPVPLKLNPRPIDQTALKAVFQELLGES